MECTLRYLALILLCCGLSFSLTACSVKQSDPQDILTQTVVSKDKIPVTVLVKYAFSIHAFEKAAEKQFPQLDLIQVGNYTSDRGLAEYESRLEHDDLTDIVMTWPLDVGRNYWKDTLLNLSGLPFTSNYNTAMLDSISTDGELYYLPGPSQIRGIVYNKTLFEEKGWEVPTDFDSFIALCQTIEADGIRSFQLGFANSEVLDTAFTGFSYADSFSKPDDSQWIADYNKGNGSFGDHFTPALETFQQLIHAGVLKESDLNITYSDRERMFFNRECAMIEDSVLLMRMGYSLTGSTDEFAMMPFFNPGEESDWARLYMVCYIGLNKDLAEPGNKEKYELVLQLMEYISTPEGQAALMGDNGAMFSSLQGVAAPEIPEIEHLIPALEHGRYAVFPELKNAQSALRAGLAGMLRGEATIADVVQMVDDQNIANITSELPKLHGQATEDFSLIETGNYITDVMRNESECEIALFLDNGKDGRYNGKGVSARIYQGDLTEVDIKRIMPDLKHGEKGELLKTTMTGADLLKTLEHSIVVDYDNNGWFYYFSGLKMEYAPAAAAGNRIKKITTTDGSSIDPQRVYKVAVMDDTVPSEYLKSCEETNVLIADLLAQNIEEAQMISPSGDDRFTVVLP